MYLTISMILKPLCCGILPRRGAIQSRVSFASTVKAENMDDYSFTKKIYKKKTTFKRVRKIHSFKFKTGVNSQYKLLKQLYFISHL